MLQVAARPADAALLARRDDWIALHPAHGAAYRRAEQSWRLAGAALRGDRRALERRPTRKWRRGVLGVAAAAVAACLAAFAIPDLQLRLQADYRSGTGEVRDVTLPDGSVVTLDAESAIAFGHEDRRVELLEGRAFFQVTPDQAQPFTVAAGDAAVIVLGTAFDVAFTDHAVTVAVERGSVQVTAPGSAASKLGPGDTATIDRASGAVVAGKTSPAGIAGWRTGRLAVEGVPVADVIEEIARHHRGWLLLRDPALGGRRVTGVFDLHNPEAALRALLQPYGAEILHITPYLLMVRGT